MKLYIVEKPSKDNEVTLQQAVSLDDGSVEYLYAGHFLDKVQASQRNDVLQALIKKVAYGGNIVFTGLDIEEVARKLFIAEINSERALNKIYENRSASTLEIMRDYISSKAIEVKVSRLNTDTMEYIIKGHRNNV